MSWRDILFCGDPHGVFTPAIQAALTRRPAALVLLGDYQLDRPLHAVMAPVIEAGIRVLAICGNHDSDRQEWWERYEDSGSVERIDGRIVSVDGPDGPVRIAGLGGTFGGNVWCPDQVTGGMNELKHGPHAITTRLAARAGTKPAERYRSGLTLRHMTRIWPEDVHRLALQSADILVTHEAPRPHRHGFQALGELAEWMGVRVHIHGHHHEDYQEMGHAGAHVVGVGLAGVYSLAERRHMAPGLLGNRKQREKR